MRKISYILQRYVSRLASTISPTMKNAIRLLHWAKVFGEKIGNVLPKSALTISPEVYPNGTARDTGDRERVLSCCSYFSSIPRHLTWAVLLVTCGVLAR